MTSHGQPTPSSKIEEIGKHHPHVRQYLQSFFDSVGEFPMFVEDVERSHNVMSPNILYPVEGPIFCHIYGDSSRDTEAYYLEPSLPPEDHELMKNVRNEILNRAADYPAPLDDEKFREYLDQLLEKVIDTEGQPESESLLGSPLLDGVESMVQETFYTDAQTYQKMRYVIHRDIVGMGTLEPLMKDKAIEDIHIFGPESTRVDHEAFGQIPTSVRFNDLDHYNAWIQNICERMQQPISDKNPIIDATMPDGSRINIVYSNDVSIQGPTVTIRQTDEMPLSVLELVEFGTLSPKLAAYMWMCLEADSNVFVVGETASGKTTTLNAITSFIPRNSKVYTAEDTAEVKPPHDGWQQLLTREDAGDSGTTDVTMFDLVETALRSRPDYILIGEVRGEEGRMAFQAAQTGHPIMLTFHAPSIKKMIDRFTGDPINVPEPMLGHIDVALFQNLVSYEDQDERRVTEVREVESYSKDQGGVISRQMFEWDNQTDEIEFTGRNNSWLLEHKVAEQFGLADPRDAYVELSRRASIVERLVEEGITGYHETNNALATFARSGVEDLPISQEGLSGV